MRIELTQASAEEREKLISGRMTPALAARYLRSGEIALRTFPEMLKEMYPFEDAQQRLIAEFVADDPEIAPSSVQRKVHNWLSGQNTPSQREDIFRIAFALGLSEAQANLLLGFCTDYGIHYRDGRDVIYAWFLRRGGSYQEARAFFATLPPVPRPKEVPAGSSEHLTQEIQSDFLRPASKDELRKCYLANLERFGELHLRAYKYFRGYLDQLIRPQSAWGSEEEPAYSLDSVMNLYLSLKIPSGKKRSQYNLVQKLIKRDWPNSTALKNIRSQREDVPRKLLLLLYVITENLLDDGGDDFLEYASLEERLDDHWWVLNSILLDCGMPVLDPRSPTDWLVLYAITADEDEPMSERMEQVIEKLFNEL